MDVSALREVFQELRFTAEMHESVLDRLAPAAEIRNYPARAVIFREGARNGDFFLVRQGRVALQMNVPGRGQVTILTVGPGEMLAWSALISEGQMTATAMAMDGVQLVVASGAELRELCEKDHEFGYHLMRRMSKALAQRLLATRLQLLDTFSDTSPTIRQNVVA
jgi:CRP-like cAMP-binding protein